MAEDVEWHLRTNKELWRKWLANGITPGKSFVVDFHFYAPKKHIADGLVASLEGAGFAVKPTITRTLIFWRGWEIEASAEHEWTLEYLNERTYEFFRNADECGFSFEGFGAEMP